MDWMLTLIFILATLYILITLLIHFGLGKSIIKTDYQPMVSILIAARNEEKNLPDCLSSIEKIEYPRDKIQVLIINDRSSDRTSEIAQTYCKRLRHFSVLKIIDSVAGLSGKMNVLAQGIDKTSNEIILITDADCEVPTNWVSNFVRYFHEGVGMCGGLTLLSKKEKQERFFTRLQALDWIYLQAVASGSCHLGLAVSILGNNFAFRRKAYEDVGGFRKLGFSVTEDMALLQALHKSKKWEIVYPLQIDTMIYSKPVETIKNFYMQRKRWVLGGKTTHWWAYFISLISLISHLMMGYSFILGMWQVGLIITATIMLADISIFTRILNRIERLDLFKMVFAFKLYYIIYTIIFSIVVVFSKQVVWKENVHQI
jgi:cellulose synthase/poly-beta-1,6-N-acetylglucosamine synthase-like glycosyltransferase